MFTFIPVYEFPGSLTLTLDGKSHHLGPLRKYNPVPFFNETLRPFFALSRPLAPGEYPFRAGAGITVHRKQAYVAEMKPQPDCYFLSCPLPELKYAMS
ncbi:hypothetical protein [Enterobacter mori]|uniref:hypothetical protein n=1 Tax=Enterobacter mori TaxID=539813 RepID=UPI003D6EF881